VNARRNGTFPGSSAPRTCGDRLEVRAFRQTRPLDCQALTGSLLPALPRWNMQVERPSSSGLIRAPPGWLSLS